MKNSTKTRSITTNLPSGRLSKVASALSGISDRNIIFDGSETKTDMSGNIHLPTILGVAMANGCKTAENMLFGKVAHEKGHDIVQRRTEINKKMRLKCDADKEISDIARPITTANVPTPYMAPHHIAKDCITLIKRIVAAYGLLGQSWFNSIEDIRMEREQQLDGEQVYMRMSRDDAYNQWKKMGDSGLADNVPFIHKVQVALIFWAWGYDMTIFEEEMSALRTVVGDLLGYIKRSDVAIKDAQMKNVYDSYNLALIFCDRFMNLSDYMDKLDDTNPEDDGSDSAEDDGNDGDSSSDSAGDDASDSDTEDSDGSTSSDSDASDSDTEDSDVDSDGSDGGADGDDGGADGSDGEDSDSDYNDGDSNGDSDGSGGEDSDSDGDSDVSDSDNDDSTSDESAKESGTGGMGDGDDGNTEVEDGDQQHSKGDAVDGTSGITEKDIQDNLKRMDLVKKVDSSIARMRKGRWTQPLEDLIDKAIDEQAYEADRKWGKYSGSYGDKESKITKTESYTVHPQCNDRIVVPDDHIDCSSFLLDRYRSVYAGLAAKIGNQAITISTRLKALLMARSQSSTIRGQRRGKLDTRSLHRLNTPNAKPNLNVFKRVEQGIKVDTSIVVLIDQSGSMGGNKMKLAKSAAILMAETFKTLESLGLEWAIYGFTSGKTCSGYYGRNDEIIHYEFKGFHDDWRQANVQLRIANNQSLRQNIDHESLGWACNLVHNRQTKRKIVLVLSDGHPEWHHSGGFGHRDAGDLLLSTIKLWRDKGIEIGSIGIMTDAPRGYYGYKTPVVNSIQDLPVAVMSSVKELLMK